MFRKDGWRRFSGHGGYGFAPAKIGDLREDRAMGKPGRIWKACMLGGVAAAAVSCGVSAQEPDAGRPSGFPRLFGNFFLVQKPAQPAAPGDAPKLNQPAAPGLPPTSPLQPPSPGTTPPTFPGQTPTGPGGAPSAGESALAAAFRNITPFAPAATDTGTPAAGGAAPGILSTTQSNLAAAAPSTSVVSGAESVTRQTTDAGDLLGKSFSSVGVELQKRNPITTDPHIRGYHLGQVVTTADGAFWVPARADLDTIVSRLDSASIANIVVIKGPYSVRHGPGFAFLDIETLSTPRYAAYETHASSALSYKTNGEGFNGRQAVWGGGADYGFRVDYDFMTANDYETGLNGFYMPSSYNSQDFNMSLGFDFSPDSRIELRALHLSQRDVEFPGIVTDLTKAITDGYTLRFFANNQEYFDRLVVDAWYNQTRFTGDSLSSGKARQFPVLTIPVTGGGGLPFQARYTVETNGETHTFGFREAVTWGQPGMLQFTAGLDFSYISTAINEFNSFPQTGAAVPVNDVNFPIPRSYSTDPGVFFETLVPVGEKINVRSGLRFDYQQSRIVQPPNFYPGASVNETQSEILTGQLEDGTFDTQTFGMWSAYITGEYNVTDELSALLGYGFAQRPPTLTELFTAGTFLGVLQPGLTFVKGSPELAQERLNQVDFGMKANYENVRVGGNMYYAHVNNYITYQRLQDSLSAFTGYKYINTANAALTGCEAYAETDVTDWLTGFGTFYYTVGTDLTRNEPLPNILPMDARVGMRIHEPGRQPTWGTEFVARMVNAQTRVAYFLGDYSPISAGTNELPTAGFTTFDLRGYWSITKNVLATAGVENIGDRFYREHLDYRAGRGAFQPGRNIYFGMRVTY